MRIFPIHIPCVLIALVSALRLCAAPALTLSPASMPNDSTGILTHTITGLATGEKITVERIADLNGNGSVEANEPTLRSFIVTDGVRPIIGGIVNGNVPGDDDASVNGAIRVDLPLAGVDAIVNRTPGKYVLRVTGPSGPATQAFEITAVNLPQRITGTVRNRINGLPVQFALVVVLAGDGHPTGSVRADGAGVYTLNAPAGNYGLLPLANGLLGTFTNVNLPSGQTVTQLLVMDAAPIRVTGRVMDIVTQTPAPSQFVIADSDSEGITGALTDLAGNYAFSIRAGTWNIHPQGDFAAQTGHVIGDEQEIQAVTGPMTVDLTVARADSLIYGRVTDKLGAPLAGLAMRAQGIDPTISVTVELEGAGRTSANGDYWLAVSGGTAGMECRFGPEDIQNAQFLPEEHRATPVNGQAILSNFALQTPSGSISGSIKNSSGQGLADIGLHASATIGGLDYQSDIRTSESGDFSVPVINGTWNLSLNCNDLEPLNYSCPSGQTVVINNNSPTVNFVVQNFTSTAALNGRVVNASGTGVSGVQLSAFASGSGIMRNGTSASGDGSFSIGVNAGHWTLQVAGNSPAGLVGPSLDFDVTAGVNLNNIEMKLAAADATITGTLKSTNGTPLNGVQIFASALVNGITYFLPSVTTTSLGGFTMAAPRGTVTLNPDCNQVQALGYNCPNQPALDTASGSATVDITVTTIQGPQLTSSRLTTGGASPLFEFTIQGGPADFDIHGSPTVPFVNGAWTKLGEITIPVTQPGATSQFNPQGNRFFRVQRK